MQHSAIWPMVLQRLSKSERDLGVSGGAAQFRSATPRTSTLQHCGAARLDGQEKIVGGGPVPLRDSKGGPLRGGMTGLAMLTEARAKMVATKVLRRNIMIDL